MRALFVLQLPEGWRVAVPVDPMVQRCSTDLLDCRSVQSFEVRKLASAPVVPAQFSSLGEKVKDSHSTLLSSKELDRLMADAHRRKFDAVLVWKIDRFGRSLRHLVNALADLVPSNSSLATWHILKRSGIKIAFWGVWFA